MSGQVPGQAEYEVWRAAVPDVVCNVPGGPWGELPESVRAGFAAIAAAPQPAPGLSVVMALARELAAEADEISPGGRGLPHDIAWADALRSCSKRITDALGQPSAAQPAPELAAAESRQLDETRERLGLLEDGIGNLAAGLKLSADASRPSKKSGIEDGCAAALLGLLDPR